MLGQEGVVVVIFDKKRELSLSQPRYRREAAGKMKALESKMGGTSRPSRSMAVQNACVEILLYTCTPSWKNT